MKTAVLQNAAAGDLHVPMSHVVSSPPHSTAGGPAGLRRPSALDVHGWTLVQRTDHLAGSEFMVILLMLCSSTGKSQQWHPVYGGEGGFGSSAS